jgi:predicted ATP-grasp superfamily ATP-dependent carboligase
MFHIEAGTATLQFQHRRCHEWPPEGGVSTLCVSEPIERHPAQRVLSEKLLHSIGWQGTAMVEYRFDAATGRYWLMEINGRFWGSIPLASHAGAEFAWEAYRQAFGEDQSEARPYRAGVPARFMIPETRRLLRILFNRSAIADPVFKPRPFADLMSYFVGFIDPRMRYYVFSWQDPMPFVADIMSMIRKALRWETN